MTINQAYLLRKSLAAIPAWRSDRGIRNFMDQLILLLSQTATATGEGGGTSETTVINEAESDLISTYSAVADLSDRLDELERNLVELISGEDVEDRLQELDDSLNLTFQEEFKTAAVDGGVFQSSDMQFVTASLNATVILPEQPVPNSVIIVKKIDNSRQIMIGGNGRTIDGCNTVTIRNKNTALTMQYDVERDEFFIR